MENNNNSNDNTKIKSEIDIILIGGTGNGKSKFSNFISKNDGAFKVGQSTNSETNTINKLTFQRCGKNITIIDTPGFNDTENHDANYKKLIIDYLKKNEIDIILLTLSFANPRFVKENGIFLNELTELYGKQKLLAHLYILYTNFPDYPDEDDNDKLNHIMGDIFNVIKKSMNLEKEDLILPIFFVNSKLKGPRAKDFQNVVDDMIKQIKLNQEINSRLLISNKYDKMKKGGIATSIIGGVVLGIGILGSAIFPPSAIAFIPGIIGAGTVLSTGGAVVGGIGSFMDKKTKNK